MIESAPPSPRPGSLAAVRAQFVAAGRTLRNVRRDFAEWHGGRPRYALWAIPLDLPAVAARVAAADAHLAGLLLTGYRRQPHVTLALCGFPQRQPRRRDDYGPAALAAQLGSLRSAPPGPFEIEIGGLATFGSAPFLTVHDSGGGLAMVRARLAAADLNRPDGPYTPHVTVGLYAGAWPAAEVLCRIDGFVAPPPLRLRVDRIALLTYDTRDIAGPLLQAAEFDLRDGALLPGGAAAAGFDEAFFAPAEID
ncbi:2'-5' RNA ligase family protein [Azoarcus olearius]|uniref:2'-5' RNA ligase family protein n=1 Tax=Azoarcus sp. (strain BH72) TaxID=418699 RepID=A1K1I1_AZOSB|nr:2'-5' RNA ligase family protein [Azoarcus olearius]ANQ83161.1 hypothetical protein dqs_0078 [Azoarcus olearius]CAL92686.1 Hypothetical protein azo0068 [Azoarcus olearius]